jgi:hypothetical protein
MVGAPTQTISTLTAGGSGMTFRSRNTSTGDNFNTVEHWYMDYANLSSGALSIVATPSAACRMIGWAVVRYNVDQSSPFNGTDAFAEGNDSTITKTVSSVTGQLVVDGASSSGARTYAQSGGQTERTNYVPSDTILGSEEAGAASVTMGWNITGGADVWFTLVWILKPLADPSVGININSLRPAIFQPGFSR